LASFTSGGKMRIAIIGGSGLIGTELTKELVDHGHTVTILTRKDPLPSRYGESWKRWNGKDVEQLAVLLAGIDTVINLAGVSIGSGRWTKEKKAAILSSRVECGQALAKAIMSLEKEPEVVVQASAVGFYGTGNEIFDETSQMGKDWLATVCRDWENSLDGIDGSTVRKIIIRSGVVLSTKGGILGQMKLPIQLFVGGPLGNGDQWISWIHIKDEVCAIRFLIETTTSNGIYNLSSPEPVTNRDFGRILAKQLHRPFWIKVPAFLVKVLLGEMSTLVIDGQKVIPKKLAEANFGFEFPGLEAALQDLLV
jgi:uncharacterized protein (TIGR01777 family)